MIDENEFTPRPVEVRLCTLCGEKWVSHLLIALSALQQEWDDEQDYDSMEINPIGINDVQDSDVQAWMCVLVLKEANRGLMGPQGPMGAPGRDAA